MREKRKIKERVEILDMCVEEKKKKKRKEKEMKRMAVSEMKTGKII